MRQVLDFFELLSPEADSNFVWNLKLATTNSPLTVEGEPYSIDPAVDVRAIAYEQKTIVEETFKALSEGRRPVRRLSSTRRDTIKRILRRNMNGIGKTEAILTASERPLFVTPTLAARSVEALERDEATDFQSLFRKDRSRIEIGTVEGELVSGETDYNTPSVLIKERNTSQVIPCRLAGELKDKVSAQTTLNDVWSHCRVRVRGRISYAANGSIIRVWAHELTLLSPRPVAIDEIADPSFTSGLSITEYLERLREGNLG